MSDIQGERGPQGDHGQVGPRGPQGESGRNWYWWGRPALRTAAFLLVVSAAVFATYRIDQRGIRNLQRAELRTCERVQFLRDQANGTNFLIYNTFKQIVDQQRGVIKSGKLHGAALKQAQQAVKRSEHVVKTTVVTGPTDCHGAVFAAHYKAPAPEFIYRNTPRIRAARQHSADIIRKAKQNRPLYQNNGQPIVPKGD